MVKVVFDYSKLKGRVTEKFDSQDAFCKKAEISPTQLSRILNGKSYPSAQTIFKFCEILEIEKEEIGTYFYTVRG